MGGLRFELCGYYRWVCLQRYRGTFIYSSTVDKLPPLSQPIEGEGFASLHTNFYNAMFMTIPHVATNMCYAPLLKYDENRMDMQIVT